MSINFTILEKMTIHSALQMITILKKNKYDITIENGKILLYHN